MVAPRILWRYILRDVLLYTLLGLAVFTLLLVVDNTLRVLEKLLGAGIGWRGLLGLIGVILPTYLSYAIPTSLLLGVLLAFGRMAADGEIVAIRASGISVPRLLPPIFLLGSVAAVFTGYLIFDLEPLSHDQMKRMVQEMASASDVAEPGQFQRVGDQVIYVDDLGDEACALKGVLIGDLSDPHHTHFISARCGSIAKDKGSQTIAVDLVDGAIDFSESGSDRFRRIRFVKMHTSLDLENYLRRGLHVQDMTFASLLALRQRYKAGENPDVRNRGGLASVKVEIQRRLAFPFSCILLTFLSVPLGIRPLRAGRSTGALTAVSLMGLYWLLFTAGEIAGENEWLPAWFSMWVANGVVLVLAIYLMHRSTRGDT